jgi:hypothetical protein
VVVVEVVAGLILLVASCMPVNVTEVALQVVELRKVFTDKRKSKETDL